MSIKTSRMGICLRLGFAASTLIVMSCIFTACNSPEPLSTVPKIILNNIAYKEIDSGQDSLILFIDFEDGEGDLGLDANESIHPYHEYDMIIDADTTFVTLNGNNQAPFGVITPAFFSPPSLSSPLFSNTDNRPEFSCDHYEIGYLNGDQNIFVRLETADNIDLDLNVFSIDTLYVSRNESRFNIYVDFFRKVGDDYEFVDWKRAFDENGCGFDFNARFPIFDEENIGSSLEGTIKYTMRSSGFNIILREDVFKLRFSIQDRGLNRSNVIETEDLTLRGLLEEG